MRRLTASLPVRLLKGRFTGLTIVLVTLFVLTSVIPDKGIRDVAVGLAFSALLLFAVLSVQRRVRIATIALAIPTLVGHWTLRFSDMALVRGAGFALVTVFLGFLTLVILFAVFKDQEVTADTIVGAVCAYLLLGVTWGTVYALLEVVSPGSLSVSPALAQTAGWGEPVTPVSQLMQYYSFTTLATLGYGDVTPLGPAARSLSVLEGVTGQLYLAVLIARLVGMHTARISK